MSVLCVQKGHVINARSRKKRRNLVLYEVSVHPLLYSWARCSLGVQEGASEINITPLLKKNFTSRDLHNAGITYYPQGAGSFPLFAGTHPYIYIYIYV